MVFRIGMRGRKDRRFPKYLIWRAEIIHSAFAPCAMDTFGKYTRQNYYFSLLLMNTNRLPISPEMLMGCWRGDYANVPHTFWAEDAPSAADTAQRAAASAIIIMKRLAPGSPFMSLQRSIWIVYSRKSPKAKGARVSIFFAGLAWGIAHLYKFVRDERYVNSVYRIGIKYFPGIPPRAEFPPEALAVDIRRILPCKDQRAGLYKFIMAGSHEPLHQMP